MGPHAFLRPVRVGAPRRRRPVGLRPVGGAPRSLRKNNSVVRLGLGDNSIGHRGVEAVCGLLRCNQRLRDLNLSNNHLVGPFGAAHFGALLEDRSCVLECLALSGCSLMVSEGGGGGGAALEAPKEGLLKLALGLGRNSSLRSLALAKNGINSWGARELAVAMQENTSVGAAATWFSNFFFISCCCRIALSVVARLFFLDSLREREAEGKRAQIACSQLDPFRWCRWDLERAGVRLNLSRLMSVRWCRWTSRATRWKTSGTAPPTRCTPRLVKTGVWAETEKRAAAAARTPAQAAKTPEVKHTGETGDSARRRRLKEAAQFLTVFFPL